MTVQELKKELRSRGQKVGGKKAELLQRLSAAIEAEEIESSTPTKPDDNDAPQTDFADFEEYINDEYNRLNSNQNNEEIANDDALNLDDIIDANGDEQQNEAEEEKHSLLETD